MRERYSVVTIPVVGLSRHRVLPCSQLLPLFSIHLSFLSRRIPFLPTFPFITKGKDTIHFTPEKNCSPFHPGLCFSPWLPSFPSFLSPSHSFFSDSLLSNSVWLSEWVKVQNVLREVFGGWRKKSNLQQVKDRLFQFILSIFLSSLFFCPPLFISFLPFFLSSGSFSWSKHQNFIHSIIPSFSLSHSHIQSGEKTDFSPLSFLPKIFSQTNIKKPSRAFYVTLPFHSHLILVSNGVTFPSLLSSHSNLKNPWNHKMWQRVWLFPILVHSCHVDTPGTITIVCNTCEESTNCQMIRMLCSSKKKHDVDIVSNFSSLLQRRLFQWRKILWFCAFLLSPSSLHPHQHNLWIIASLLMLGACTVTFVWKKEKIFLSLSWISN